MAKKKQSKKNRKAAFRRYGFNPFCVDCNVNVDYICENYMVHDHVWQQAGMSTYGGKLCVKCLENRLGRKLDRRDFLLCPLNIEPYFHKEVASKRLRKRLRATF